MNGKRRSSLTGSWSGAYRYQHGAETVFNAQIEEVAGAFVGVTQEPNRLDWVGGSVLTAAIEGVRQDASVSFTKVYRGRDWYAIRYEGAADDTLMRVEGRWTIPGEWSGAFFMVRDDDGEEAQAEEFAEADGEARR